MGFKTENGILIRYTEEKGVTEADIPENVTNIGKGAFEGCGKLNLREDSCDS